MKNLMAAISRILATFRLVFEKVWDGTAFVTRAVVTAVANVGEVAMTAADAVFAALSLPGRIFGGAGRAAAGQQAAAAGQQAERQAKATAQDAEKDDEIARVARQLQRMARLRLKDNGRAVAEVGSTVPAHFIGYIKALSPSELNALGHAADAREVAGWLSGKLAPPAGVRTVDEVQARSASTAAAPVGMAAQSPGRTPHDRAVIAQLGNRINALRRERADDDYVYESGYAAA